MRARINAVMVTAEDVSQIENKKITYDELLRQIKKEHQAKAKEFIPLSYVMRYRRKIHFLAMRTYETE